MPDIGVSARDGTQLAVRDHGGNGPDVLFLHGVTRTLIDWELVVRELRGVRAVAMDMRWHGLSGVPAAFVWQDFLDDVDDVTEALGLDDPLVVGHSYGGGVAGAWAATHSGSRGAINIDGYQNDLVDLFEGVDRAGAEEFVRRMKEMQNTFIPTTDEGDGTWRDTQLEIAEGMEQSFGLTGDLAREAAARSFVPAGRGRFERRPPKRFYDVAWSDPAIPNVIETISTIECPFVFLKCMVSDFAPPPGTTDYLDAIRRGTVNAVRAVAERKPNITIETMDAGHGVIFTHPAEIARLVSTRAKV